MQSTPDVRDPWEHESEIAAQTGKLGPGRETEPKG